jgi:hypothetical protein
MLAFFFGKSNTYIIAFILKYTVRSKKKLELAVIKKFSWEFVKMLVLKVRLVIMRTLKS